MDQADQPANKSHKGLLIMALVLVGGGAAGGIALFLGGGSDPVNDDAGFNMTDTGSSQASPAVVAALAKKQDSSLGMIDTSGVDLKDPNAQAAARSRPEDIVTRLVRENEPKIRKLAEKYAREHPAILAYGREWMSKPDLRKLNDDFMRDRDPIKFLRGLAKAPSLGPLLRKYAKESSIQQFVVEVHATVPRELLAASYEVMQKEDRSVARVINTFSSAMGLPPLMGGPDIENKVDGKGTLMNAEQTQLSQPTAPK